MPVPERLTVGLVAVFVATVRVSLRVPAVPGVKKTDIEQLAPPASVLGDTGQVVVYV